MFRRVRFRICWAAAKQKINSRRTKNTTIPRDFGPPR
jgi:hypothetical protein